MDRAERLRRQKEFLIKFAYWAVWGSIGIFAVKFVGPALLPFIIAFFVAWLLSEPVRFLTERVHIKRNLAAIVAVTLFYGLIGGLLYLLGSRIVELVQDVSSDITAFLSGTIYPLVSNFCGWMTEITGGGKLAVQGGNVDTSQLVTQAGQVVSGMSEKVISGVSGIAASLPGICMNVFLSVIATLFIELDFPKILEFLSRQVPKKWKQTVTGVKSYMIEILWKCVLSYVLILGLTFVELAVGFFMLEVEGAFTIAFIIAILDILPVLGTGTVLLPWTVIAMASGNLKMGIGVLALYLLITIVRNIVEPRIVGHQMGLSPVVMLPCMIVGLKLFGIIGLFGLPLAVAFLKNLNDRGIMHIVKDENGR